MLRKHDLARAAAYVVAALLLPSCGLPETDSPLPHLPGTYPATEGGPRAGVAMDRGWAPLLDFAVAMDLEVSPADFLSGLGPSARVPARRLSWPAPVRLAGTTDEETTVRGDAVRISDLGDDVRCHSAVERVAFVGVISRAGPSLRVRVTYEGIDPAECEVSAAGRRRAGALAADLWWWSRSVARTGSTLPRR